MASKIHNPDPAEILKQRQIKEIYESRKCVDFLRALDFINQNPEYAAYKQKLAPHNALIKRARAARDQVRERCNSENREWLKGHEEYCAIEQHLIKSLGPSMKQSEYQALERAYLEQKKTESIERWKRSPISILGGGFLP